MITLQLPFEGQVYRVEIDLPIERARAAWDIEEDCLFMLIDGNRFQGLFPFFTDVDGETVKLFARVVTDNSEDEKKRQNLISLLRSNDHNGCWSDYDNLIEYGQIATYAELLECAIDQELVNEKGETI